MECESIDLPTYRMQSDRSTIWANTPKLTGALFKKKYTKTTLKVYHNN